MNNDRRNENLHEFNKLGMQLPHIVVAACFAASVACAVLGVRAVLNPGPQTDRVVMAALVR